MSLAPVISMQPSDHDAAVGATASLSLVASDANVAGRSQRGIDASSTWSDDRGATQAGHGMRFTAERRQRCGTGQRG